MVMYFGFTHCPDVCPDELEKMSVAISKLDKLGVGNMVVPIFVSVDPGRDTPEVVKKYIKEFHPRFVGLTGDDEEVKKVAKLFRIYISKSDVDKDGDYLVDHSIFFFLMDPENGFKDYYGRNATADDIVSGIRKHVEQWKMDHK
jgi:protein SCO1/2